MLPLKFIQGNLHNKKFLDPRETNQYTHSMILLNNRAFTYASSTWDANNRSDGTVQAGYCVIQIAWRSQVFAQQFLFLPSCAQAGL